MAEKNVKELLELKEKLNSRMEPSGVKILGIQEPEKGKFELITELDPKKVDQTFLATKDKLKGLVCERKIAPDSLLGRMCSRSELSALDLKLEEAYKRDQLNNPDKEVARLETRYRDALTNDYLDARDRGPEYTNAVNLYKRSEDEYLRTGIYGTTIDLLSNFSATGFYNEITDKDIKEYYDSWVRDSDFIFTAKKVFHDLFKYGVCYILPALGTYEPHQDGISSIPGKVPNSKTKTGFKAAVGYAFNELIKKITSKPMDFVKFSEVFESGKSGNASIPILYTILDPKNITIDSTGFFNKVVVTLKNSAFKSLNKLLKDPNKKEYIKDVLKLFPSGLRKAIEEGKDYIFKDEELQILHLRKEDFEAYSKPRGSRAFDSFDYKDELKKADFATIDGITSYILKVTVGDKDNPVTDPATLEALADAFNTPQKAFSIVWNHTLDIEKISANEMGTILGQTKYEPVDKDINAALGIARALIDGTNLSADAANLAVKSLQSEINAVREVVEKWIYGEYKTIARAVGFQTYPVVRWKTTVISTDSDAVTRTSFMQMLDRKAISVQTYMREQGFDYDTEVTRMEEELPLIQQDVLRAGSPFQKSTTQVTAPQSPDAGRPLGQPSVTKNPVSQEKVTKRKTKVPSPSQASEVDSNTLDELVGTLSQLDEDTKTKIIEALVEKEQIKS